MLVVCPECGRQVSDKAVACPGCGCPMEEILKQFTLKYYDPETMTGETPDDCESIAVAEDLYGELLVSQDGRVWNAGGQVVGRMKFR